MADETLEWFPFKYMRFLIGTAKFDATEVGAYMLLLIEQWRKGFVPDDRDQIEDIARCKYEQMPRVLKKFQKKGDKLKNGFLEQIRKEQKTKHAKASGKARNAAKKRWSKDATSMQQAYTSMPIEENRIDKNRKEEREENAHTQKNSHDEKNDPVPGIVPWPAAEGSAHQKTPAFAQTSAGQPPGSLHGASNADRHIAEVRRKDGETPSTAYQNLRRILRGKYPEATEWQFFQMLEGFAGKFDNNHEKGHTMFQFGKEWEWYCRDNEPPEEPGTKESPKTQQRSRYKTVEQLGYKKNENR